MKDTLLLCTIVLGFCLNTGLLAQDSSERPNIVWLVTEDNAWHYLRLYNPDGAAMPHIEALAEQGIVFNHAFSNGPVCSVARSTLISGCYAPRIGAQYHRRMDWAPLPEGLDMFPAYLRKAGYYTTNNNKQDYNLLLAEDVWDESSPQASYQNRKPGQPFFHVQNFGITHEGQLHFSREKMENTPTEADPVAMKPFPYHPDTETSRYTYAWYQDLHQKADAQMGQFIETLRAEGLLENTIIFYYGDHGGVLPRSKGYIYESGLHVPLVVYVPEKWKALSPVAAGSRTDAFVQFIDFGPTVLNLAGVAVPEQMDGKPFLGRGVSPEALRQRNTTFSYADRFDEKYDLVRAMRKGNFKYMRNYQPFNPDALFNFYRNKMLLWQEWTDLYAAGELDETQQQFFQARAPEALYDLENDPHEVHNLVDDPDYHEILLELRGELQQHLRSLPDLSFFPEPWFLEKGLSNPVQFGQQHQSEIAALIDLADLSLLPFAEAKSGIRQALRSGNVNERYWALIVCSSFGRDASGFQQQARKMIQKDPEVLVQMRAVEFLSLTGETVEPTGIVNLLDKAATETEAILMLNTVALLKTVVPGFEITIPPDIFDPAWRDEAGDLVNRRLEFIQQTQSSHE